MKKIILILIFSICTFLKESNAQVTGVSDTLAYLQSIVTNKAQYIGQPFSVLYNNLQIQIKFFSPFAAIPYDKNKETSTSFSFYFPETADDMYLAYPKFEIYWQPYLNMNQSLSLFNFNNGGGWSSAVIAFYANGIISDIKIRE